MAAGSRSRQCKKFALRTLSCLFDTTRMSSDHALIHDADVLIDHVFVEESAGDYAEICEAEPDI